MLGLLHLHILSTARKATLVDLVNKAVEMNDEHISIIKIEFEIPSCKKTPELTRVNRRPGASGEGVPGQPVATSPNSNVEAARIARCSGTGDGKVAQVEEDVTHAAYSIENPDGATVIDELLASRSLWQDLV